MAWRSISGVLAFLGGFAFMIVGGLHYFELIQGSVLLDILVLLALGGIMWGAGVRMLSVAFYFDRRRARRT